MQKINRFLEWCGLRLSAGARLTLITLLIFLGITSGFLYALHRVAGKEKQPTAGAPSNVVHRGADIAAINAVCAHIAVDFAPTATAGELKRLLRAADAVVLYGPDEFGRFQLRLADGPRGDGTEVLRGSTLVDRITPYPDCP